MTRTKEIERQFLDYHGAVHGEVGGKHAGQRVELVCRNQRIRVPFHSEHERVRLLVPPLFEAEIALQICAEGRAELLSCGVRGVEITGERRFRREAVHAVDDVLLLMLARSLVTASESAGIASSKACGPPAKISSRRRGNSESTKCCKSEMLAV